MSNFNVAEGTEDYRNLLKADCEQCFGLCCVALPFAASADFAMDKNAGSPCHNLQENFRCSIHAGLREQGFRGCTVYDCFGAGQQVSQVTFGSHSWRQAPESAELMFEVFPIMRQLHEMLWYLTEALTREQAHPIHTKLQDMLNKTRQLTRQDAQSVMTIDVTRHRAEVNELLMETSELIRAGAERATKGSSGRRKAFGRGADLIGAKLKGADLRGANLRGAYLIAADLRDANLRWADLIGADMRDADIRGADLTDSIFLVQGQVNSARGDEQTKLPPALSRPSYWASGAERR
ncbi:pentapeptide repeat-containing protein [Paenibacillus tarimensis]|uniref:pentapeptide repeat-containing protein n=1 Tax=Paenibacillus tarimensis TaxID=416012 RepID=UPI001F162767|nr:pentapeptide repeat-containing protein [Paenibacillus tarimensis]MCF2942710.1 pentapeptide repeat-containing protein [Paenibacillus tarimensis]